jgi:hypothetical protein
MSLTPAGSARTDACVYHLGGDTLVVGFVTSDTPPEAVAAAKGVVLYTLKRVKDEARGK